LLLLTIIRPLNRRGLALFFFLIKRTKNQVSREASLRSPIPVTIAQAFALQTRQNHGLQLFCPAHTYPMLLQKLAMPYSRTGHHCSARFRPKLSC
jgi:hypothetical protein